MKVTFANVSTELFSIAARISVLLMLRFCFCKNCWFSCENACVYKFSIVFNPLKSLGTISELESFVVIVTGCESGAA